MISTPAYTLCPPPIHFPHLRVHTSVPPRSAHRKNKTNKQPHSNRNEEIEIPVSNGLPWSLQPNHRSSGLASTARASFLFVFYVLGSFTLLSHGLHILGAPPQSSHQYDAVVWRTGRSRKGSSGQLLPPSRSLRNRANLISVLPSYRADFFSHRSVHIPTSLALSIIPSPLSTRQERDRLLDVR